MSHITIVVSATSPNGSPPPTLGVIESAASYVPPAYSVNVNYVPDDSMTPAQIGDEIARITKHVNQIMGAKSD